MRTRDGQGGSTSSFPALTAAIVRNVTAAISLASDQVAAVQESFAC